MAMKLAQTHRLRAFLADEQGSMTTEFVLWVPVLGFWLLLSVVIYDAYMSRNKAAKTAHTLSDIVTRQVQVSDDFFTELYDLQGKLLTFNTGERELRVTSVQRIDDDYNVLWSASSGALPVITQETLTVELIPTMANLDTVIITESYSAWQPIAELLGLTAHTWSFTNVGRPRFVSSIVLVED